MSQVALFQEGSIPVGSESVIWRARGGDVKPPHFHGQLEFLFVRHGSAHLNLGGAGYQLHEGQVATILPGVTHFTSEFSSDLDMWVLGFEPEHVAQLLRQSRHPSAQDHLGEFSPWGDASLHLQSPFSDWMLPLANTLTESPLLHLDSSTSQEVEELCLHQFARQGEGKQPSALGELLCLFFFLLEQSASPGAALPLPLLANCLIASDPTLDRDQLCRDLGVSSSYLARSLKKGIGANMAQLRARARVATFLSLARSGQTLLASAHGAGFGSYSQLYRTFAKLTGWKPQEYLLHQGRERVARVKA